MEQNENNPEKRNIFRKAGDAISNSAKSLQERTSSVMLAAQEDIQNQLLEKIMPMVKRMIPGIETKLKDYLSGKNELDVTGKPVEKVILMKLRQDGKISIMIFNEKAIELTNKEGFPADKVLIHQIELDQYVNGFLNGSFDNMASNVS